MANLYLIGSCSFIDDDNEIFDIKAHIVSADTPEEAQQKLKEKLFNEEKENFPYMDDDLIYITFEGDEKDEEGIIIGIPELYNP